MSGTAPATPPRSLIQLAARLAGIVFVLVGVLGFVPGITTHYDRLGVAGSGSMALLLGLFMVSVLHNVVHLLFGVAGLLMARTAATARTYFLAGGGLYLVLWIYGLVVGTDSDTNVVPLNPADNWLHLGLGLAMVGTGLILGRRVVGAGRH